jgi:hypothetical protein
MVPAGEVMVDIGLDRGGAAVVADGQRHRHRVLDPGQAGVPRRHLQGTSLGREFDPTLIVATPLC